MQQRTRVLLAGAAAVLLFAAVQVGALALVGPFQRYQTIEDPTNPVNSVLYIGLLLVATALMLAVIKYGRTEVLRYVILATGGLITYYVFSIPLGTAAGAAVGLLAVAALLVHPEWYVVDAAGVVMGMGAAALFGVSFGVLPALVLLVGLAVYDAISVYGTEHMLTLAEGVMDLKVPVLFVVPTRLDYSFIDATSDDRATDGNGGPETADDADAHSRDDTDETADATPEQSDDTGESDASDGDDDESYGGFQQDALFIGLGDAVMPTILAASAAFFLDADAVAGVPIPAVTAAAGTLVGLLVLLHMVFKGRAHAGLPLLNGGAIIGYLVGALFVGVPLDVALGVTEYI